MVGARWLVDSGAARVVLNGRSDPSESQRTNLAELETRAEVVVIQGDIASPGMAERLVAAAEETGRQLRGHGLKDLSRDLLGVDISKQQQSSDWGAETLTQAQIDYAASDVLHLHALKEKLDRNLERENRLGVAHQCFAFLPTRAQLDLLGWPETDIFAHS